MRTIDAIEYGSIDVPARDLVDAEGRIHVHPSLVGRDFIDIRLKKSSLQIFAGGYVGIIPISPEIAIRVKPRAPIGNLTRVLRIAGFAPVALEQFGREYVSTDEEIPDLLEVYARSLAALVQPLKAFGLMRDYSRIDTATDTPRGRISMSARPTQLALAGASSRVGASWFQRSVDNPANRCIKFALYLLAEAVGSSPPSKGNRETMRRVNTAFGLFEGVQLERRAPPSFLADPVVAGTRALPSARNYYRDALRLSTMIARSLDIALDRSGSDLRMMPLLINMDEVFESYVRSILRFGEPFVGNELRVLDGNSDGGRKLLFDREPSSHAQPDIVITRDALVAGRAEIVADVKYKPASGPRPDRADLNQIITYGATYRAPRVLVIQPRGPRSKYAGLQFLGRISELQVFQFVFDLDADDLINEERTLVAAVAGLLREGAGAGEEATTESS